MKKRIVGIVTWHYYSNYGSMLQTYALCKTLRKMNFSVKVLNYHSPKFGIKNKQRYHLASVILSFIPLFFIKRLPSRYYQPFFRFSRYFNLTPIVYDGKSLSNQIKGFNAVICGSDQIWAPNCFNSIYMLDFVPTEMNKVSYAASIGLNDIPDSLIENYKKHIGRINHISVREEKGKTLLKERCDIDSTVVLDPTLLIKIEDWKKIQVCTSCIREPYVFCYFLRKDHSYKDSVLNFAKENGLDIYGISDNRKDGEWLHYLNHNEVGPKEFLGLIDKASVVITDSYHGTIFSLLYHKKFITIERFEENDTICQNSRIFQLAKYFGISKNIVRVGKDTNLKLEKIDYAKIDIILNQLRTISRNFLINALS